MDDAMNDWEQRARWLADETAGRDSRWHAPIAATPRHLLVPNWWRPDGGGWALHTGPGDEARWARAAYADRTLVTRVGPSHADLARNGAPPSAKPTSSSTLPTLVVQMFRHARIGDEHHVLDVGTGSGYSAALLAHRLGGNQVISIDVDPYLVRVAAERLDSLGLRPQVETVDATGPLPGTFDRIVSMVSVKPIPASWLAALKPGGRLVTCIAGTTAILTATRRDDGTAFGRIERDRAGFMSTRHGADYPEDTSLDVVARIDLGMADVASRARYPVIEVDEAFELASVLEIETPGIRHHYEEGDDGVRIAWMTHPDGSWARAKGKRGESPLVHQSGPRRLWDILDDLRHRWLTDGYLQLYGATATIKADGVIYLERGAWKATIT
jgi:protein-L-isoaspartate O-methyltransferase